MDVQRSRFSVAAVLSALLAAGATVALAAVPAGASSPDPCKLLKASEIQPVVGQPTAAGAPSIKTPVSRGCKFKMSTSEGRPAGSINITVLTTGAKVAFDRGKQALPGVVAVTGLGNAFFYSVSTFSESVRVLKGSKLMSVSGDFIQATPVDLTQVQNELTQLAKVARGRL
jgi:hypothetical protein